MKSVTVQEAKTHLSRLLREVESGEQIEIRRGRQPVAVLSPRKKGLSIKEMQERYAGRIKIIGDFSDSDEEIAREFGAID